jgi:hypothetical protein
MRTTLSIDDDVLTAARAIAHQQDRTLGEVISALARKSLERPKPKGRRNGILLLGQRSTAKPVTLDLVNALRDDLP